MYDDPTVDELIKLANDAASLATRNYVGIDPEDVAANTLEIVYKSPQRFERHLEHRGWMWSVFYAESIKYCNKCVRDFMYYSDEYYYTPQEVRELLTKVYTTDVQDDETLQINDAMLSMLDLARAYDALNFRQKDLIVRKMVRGEKLPPSDRKAYYRATERMAEILNRHITEDSKMRVQHADGPGARKALSNAQASNLTGNGWEG